MGLLLLPQKHPILSLKSYIIQIFRIPSLASYFINGTLKKHIGLFSNVYDNNKMCFVERFPNQDSDKISEIIRNMQHNCYGQIGISGTILGHRN